MDRSWMNESRMSPEYEDGVEQFLQFASKRGRPNEERKYYCPCINCLNGRRQLLDDIRDHLLCDGIKKNYTTWIWHGEVTDTLSGSQSEPFDVETGDRLEDMIRDLGQESFQQAHAPVYEGLQSDSKKPVYAGCKNSLTLLSVVLSLVNVKARYGWSDKSFTSLLEVVHNLLPEDNTLPKSYYKAKKILCPMGMEYQKIHACPNDCILYRHEFQEMLKCPIYGTSRTTTNLSESFDHGFSTCLHFSSSSSSSFGRIGFAVCREADTQSLTSTIRPVVHVDPATGKADGPHRKKLRTYLGIVARDKASDSRTKKKLLQTVGERWRQFKSDLTRKWALAADQDGVEDTVCEKYGISKEKWVQFCQTRRDPSWEDVRKKAQAIQKQNIAPHVLSRGGYDYLEQKLLAEKTKKKLEEAAQSGSVDGVIDPPSPVRRHVKWKMARTKKTEEMTTEAAKEIAEKIDSFEEQATQGSFILHGRQDVLAAAIGRPEHPGRVRAAGATADLADQGLARGVHHRESDEAGQTSFNQLQSQMQSQGLVVPPEPLVGPSGPQVSTKGSCVDPSGNDPETGDSDRCGLYIEADPARLVAMGRVYEGSTVVYNTPLLLGQVKVSVEEVTDADAPVLVPTDEVSLVGQTLHTFLAWPTHLVKSLSQQVVVSPAKPPPNPDPKVDDPLYLMTLTIPELFLRPYQVRWDAIVFGDFNPDFPLYIKHGDLSEIAHGGQCLSISVLQLWILHLTETCMRVGNSDIYGFLEPQSIQRSGQSYIKSWMQSSQRDVYLGAYLNGGHWQMVVILPKEHLVVWFCSLHNRPDNYLKGIINSAIKGLDDAPQPKSKASARWIVVKCNRQKGSTECGYYVMHWMSTIILGTFRNNWEAVSLFQTKSIYFNDPRPLDPERLQALWIQSAQFYLRVRDQA
ncbi:hypothetical protein HKD37_04G010217 [Glycine soja]